MNSIAYITFLSSILKYFSFAPSLAFIFFTSFYLIRQLLAYAKYSPSQTAYHFITPRLSTQLLVRQPPAYLLYLASFVQILLIYLYIQQLKYYLGTISLSYLVQKRSISSITIPLLINLFTALGLVTFITNKENFLFILTIFRLYIKAGYLILIISSQGYSLLLATFSPFIIIY